MYEWWTYVYFIVYIGVTPSGRVSHESYFAQAISCACAGHKCSATLYHIWWSSPPPLSCHPESNGQWGVLLPCISEVQHCFLARRHYLPYDWDTLNVTDRSGQVDASNHRHETCQGFPMDIEGPRSKVIAYSSTMPSDVNTAQKSTCQRAPMCTHHYKQHINIPKPQSWRPCKVQKSVHQGLPSTVHVTSYGRPTSRKPFRIDSHPRSLWCSHC